MKTFKKYVDKTLLIITGILFLVMVAVMTWQVISRYLLNDPSTLTEEFLRYSLVWLSILAAAYVVGQKNHIAITFLSERLKDQKKLVLDIGIQVIFLLFAAIIMVYGGTKAVSLTMAQLSPSLGLPMGLVYLSLPVGGILIIFYSIVNLIELFIEKEDALYNENKEEPTKVGGVL
ncbi:TRAP transporter small permease [Bacillus solitudinis]|uniref:TRAP transporter small permease n=1 Tax=Bacillus solitudinis TaxID=2014074 RepID=UPI000C24660E|nr:TRAP transporter small permease [Bacillus solitudinis]